QPARRAASPSRWRHRDFDFSTQREPSFDRLARGKRQLDSDGARKLAFAREWPRVSPGAALREVCEPEARYAVEQRVRGRVDTARPIVARPVEHFNGAVVEAIREALARAARLE